MLDLELNLGEVNNLLTVYDITGKEVQTLLPRRLSQGKHLLKWNAKNLTSGLYFIMIQSGNTKRVERVTFKMKDSIILKSYEVLNDMVLLKWDDETELFAFKK